jgi:hypothetical protein
MDSYLQLLISHYEAEQQVLQSLLDECLLEEDYKYARYYLKNLRLLQRTLNNLYALSDYNHAEKTKVLSFISNIQSHKKRFNNDFTSSFDEERLKKLNLKLSILNEQPVIEVEQKYDVENAIIQLLEKKINSFKLFILKTYNLYLYFTLIEPGIVHIEFTPFKNFIDDYSLNESKIELLVKRGFNLSYDQSILYIDFDLRDQTIQSLKKFLSRIFFEDFYWHLEKNSELVIN